MKMLTELKFVKGAVAKKDLLPAITHFAIENGFVRAFNGSLAMCAPIAFNIDCKPKAVQLVNAIEQCGDAQIQLSMTEKGRLRVHGGSFKAFVDCITEETPHVLPEGVEVRLDMVQSGGTTLGNALLKALHAVEPFISNDASRPWSNGVLLRDHSVYATNNVIAVQYWTSIPLPFSVNIPSTCVAEMLRINEPPIYAQVAEQSITFHYADTRWIRTALLATTWPDVDRILGKESVNTPVDKELFVGLEKLKKFTDKLGRIYIKDGVMSTSEEEDQGARFNIPDSMWTGVYNVDMLLLLKDIAEKADFNHYPNPSTFEGGMLRGAIVGMRL
jgi:hypothetical protein